MAGNRQKKSSFSFFNMFKSRRPHNRRGDDMMEDSYMSARKVWPSEEDRGQFVAEPGIDNKAAAFIDRIHKNIVSEYECQTLTVNPDGKA
ncbi:hypothetical protein D8674_023888 [Pyrus ussuriensis x Pyrus communis]|uniref:Uncharacterized protein n=1 Tax=Pyrus ussuriensis x Pyrus communis TaxID=2448454 RepID=A0A5N5H1F7_9ROSA|nr:hypothetical protein D8674_023888 [Pyrus ussuriensis x Pyrus communis]